MTGFLNPQRTVLGAAGYVLQIPTAHCSVSTSRMRDLPRDLQVARRLPVLAVLEQGPRVADRLTRCLMSETWESA